MRNVNTYKTVGSNNNVQSLHQVVVGRQVVLAHSRVEATQDSLCTFATYEFTNSLGDLVSLILLAESLIITFPYVVQQSTIFFVFFSWRASCELGPTRRQVFVYVDGMSLQPSAGPINVCHGLAHFQT